MFEVEKADYDYQHLLNLHICTGVPWSYPIYGVRGVEGADSRRW